MDNRIILDCSHYCKHAYNNDDVAKKKFDRFFENGGGLQAYVLRDNNTRTLFIVFTGTNELKDWVSNINIIPRILDNGQVVHSGYWELLHTGGLDVGILSWVMESIRKYPNVVFTGHSMGGCLAQLMAYKLFTTSKIRSDVFAYGCSAIGNNKFQKIFGDNGCRCVIVNIENDIVPYIFKKLYGLSYFRVIDIPNMKNTNSIKSHSLDTCIDYLHTLYSDPSMDSDSSLDNSVS